MDQKTFLENFGVIADAPNGVQQLREIIMSLAVEGHLVDEHGGGSSTGSWTTTTLSEVTRIRTGKLDANASSDNGAYPFFTCAKNPLKIDSYSYDTECVLLAGNGNFDVNYYAGKFDAYQRTYIIEALDRGQLFVPYLHVYMQRHSKVLLKQAIGGVIRYIKIGFLTRAPIILPPLAEQKSIVAKVDELMALCDELEAEKAKQEALRSAARDSAIDAISTATTPEELSTAWSRISNNWEMMSDSSPDMDPLRKLIYQLAFEGFSGLHADNSNNLAHNWRKLSVGEILSLEYGKPLDKTLRQESGKIPVYGANGIKCYTNEEYVSGPGIVVGRKGSAGEVNLTSGAYWPLDVSYYVVHDPNETDLLFLFHLLKHLNLTSLAHGIKPGINRNEVYRLPISLPTVPEQQVIVSKIEVLLGLCHQLAQSLEVRTDVEAAFANSSSQLTVV